LIKLIEIEKNFGIRLDKFLKNEFTSLTQGFIEKNIRKKNILINNTKTSSKYIVKKNDLLKIFNFNEAKYKNRIIFKKNINVPSHIIKKFKSFVIFENEDFLILNKWSSIATQGGSKINISINDIINKISIEYKLVHRLDKETSGLLIISKNKNSVKIFGNLFKLRLMNKTYLAICEGVPKIKESNVELNIKNKKNEIQETKTFYKVLSSHNGLSLILFKPITGKTHQLRLVSKNISCPIIGDIKYNHYSKYKNELLKLNAHILRFTFNNKEYNFFSEISEDFISFLKKYKLKYSKKNL